jgi:hypothetical protein
MKVPRTNKPWSGIEDAYLIEHAGSLSLEEIAEQLSRSARAVEHRIYALNRARGLKLTTSVIYHQWVCVNCGEVTYSPLDTEGWCEECLLKAAIERTQRNIEIEELRRRHFCENRAKLDRLNKELGARKVQLHRLRKENGTNPRKNHKDEE